MKPTKKQGKKSKRAKKEGELKARVSEEFIDRIDAYVDAVTATGRDMNRSQLVRNAILDYMDRNPTKPIRITEKEPPNLNFDKSRGDDRSGDRK